jgi:diphosphomevalonate decarboxylase
MLYGKAYGPSNIAIIKYWGARDQELNLPFNDSISITLGKELSVRTSVEFSSTFERDRLVINRVEYPHAIVEKHVGRVLKVLRKKYGKKIYGKITSNSNFPVAAGLASSAAGISALVVATDAALDLGLDYSELSKLARLGSGSACRSVFGGFVRWKKGKREDGEDSFAEQLFDERYWPELIDIVAIISNVSKKISSAEGMKVSVDSSRLFNCRIKWVQSQVGPLIDIIRRKDFRSLFELSMKETDNMHAVILDSGSELFYLNGTSLDLMKSIRNFRYAGYSFDAGPNAHILTTTKYENKVKNLLGSMDINNIIVTRAGKGAHILE